MKFLLAIFSLGLVFQAGMARAENVTGRVTILYSPLSNGVGGVTETDLRQVGDEIRGHSAIGNMNLIKLKVSGGLYQGPTGRLTSLQCDTTACSGFINGQSASFGWHDVVKHNVAYTETSGTVNNQIYTETSNATSVDIFSWNSLNLKKGPDGNYYGQSNIGISLYEVIVKMSGSMTNFMDDKALVAIFLGAPIAHQ